jgi:hypothetical protein
MIFNSIQVSTIDEMFVCDCSRSSPPFVSVVKKPVMPRDFNRSMSRTSIWSTLASSTVLVKLLTGSSTTLVGAKSRIAAVIVAR